jgi:hypothetical protein
VEETILDRYKCYGVLRLAREYAIRLAAEEVNPSLCLGTYDYWFSR